MALAGTDSFRYSCARAPVRGTRTAAYHRRMAEPVAAPSPHEQARRRDEPVPAPACAQPRRLDARGDPRRWRAPRCSTGRSSSRSATPPATGATSWSASRSRTRRRPRRSTRGFVAIKVDREERPDLDQLYMGAVQAMTGRRRLADERVPDARGPAVLRRHLLPGHAAPRDAVVPPGARGRPRRRGRRSGRRSSRRACGSSRRWSSRRRSGPAARAVGAAAARGRSTPPRPRVAGLVRPRPRRLGPGAEVPAADDDRVPAPAARRERATRGRSRSRCRSLDAMAAGGIHDQLGGGFHRYATDARVARARTSSRCSTTTPSSRACTSHAWALTGDASLLATATGVLDYVAPRARDARTAGSRPARTRTPRARRARTFVWTARRGARGPGRRRGAVLGRVRGDRRGQLGGPHDPVAGPRRRRARGAVRAGGRRGRGAGWPRRVPSLLAPARGARRSRRATTRCSRPGTGSRSRRSPTPPGRSPRPGIRRWSRRRPAIARRRSRAADAVLDDLRRPDGRLRRSWRDGRASADGVLEDYANLADGLLAAVRGDVRRALVRRRPSSLVDVVLAHFAAPRRRLLRHARRRRAAGRPAAGRPGQRDAVGRRDGRRPSCSGSRR